ncbi:hypothetical protein KW850_29800 [Bacillus sp. sid0103]|uniref:LGFP repeat-containing protein n=1 Tax=Bacillus sp. sid0103 TaxID=2856337 RepID=UPI001C47F996|nr:hypothetical protein [Bacillus sp. sid0103]MBV7509371.1 hypothetical protein [Bacillus sp. sid0103]
MNIDPYRQIPYYGHYFPINPHRQYRESEIEAKYQELLRRGFKGPPITAESTARDGVGRYRHYREPNGREWSIYWHPESGAKEVHGPIRDKWVSLGREGFGYPITDEFVTNDGTGRFNFF